MTRSAATANTADDRPRTGFAAYAIAFALLALQLTGPLHLDQHDFTEAGETCEICVQLEQFGNALATTPATASAITGKEPAPATGPVISYTRNLTGYYGRAPPHTA